MRTLNTTSTNLGLKISQTTHRLIEETSIDVTRILNHSDFIHHDGIHINTLTLIIYTQGNTLEQNTEIWESIIKNLGISGLDTTFYDDPDIFIDNDGTGAETLRLLRGINHISCFYTFIR